MNKYQIKYYQCSNCQFIQTENPYWLEEAYKSVITSLDIGLVDRNMYLSVTMRGIINAFFDRRARFLDYGGGYGLLVRLLRDKGLDFYREDKFCDNLFAKHFDVTDISGTPTFELVTAFELFEHLPNPIEEIGSMLKYGNSILFSTELQPKTKEDIENWEYIASETGQHISFYSYQSLVEISNRFGLRLYSNSKNMHLLTTKKINPFLFRLLTSKKVATLYNVFDRKHKSLLLKDYNTIKEKINKREL